MSMEDESWRKEFEGNEGNSRDGYKPSSNRENNGQERRVSASGRVLRPRISRPTFSSDYQGRASRPYQSASNRNEGGHQRPGNYQRPEGRTYGNNGRPRPEGYQPNRNADSQRPGRYQRQDENGNQRQNGYQRQGGNGYQRQNGQYAQGGKPRRQRTADYNPHAKYSQKKQIEYKETHFDPEEPIRLNKYLANAGVCSRREADDFIQAGVVRVNGVVATELGTKVKRSDEVLFHDQLISIEKKVYVLLNKPKGYVTTSDDPQNRKTVMDLVKNACRERIYPVGRLDRNTTGVLLLTNDGELASKLTHPQYMKKKIYHVFLDRNLTAADMRLIADGIMLEDGEIHADAIEYASETDKKQVGIEIHSGRNRIVRRIFDSLGYKVVKLDRVFFAGLTKKNVRRGDWRFLTEQEVNFLRMGSFE